VVVRRHVQVESQILDEHFLQICIADTGPGIADEKQDRIFRKFYRGYQASTQGQD
jgi:signal transduction histidine kinase